MLTSDPIDILLAHDRWATQQILNTCQSLSDEQFHHRFEMGPGSLHDTITHICGAMGLWTDLLAGREIRPRPEGSRRSLNELQALLDKATSEFAQHAKTRPFEETVTRERGGKSYTLTRSGVIMHVATHGMHHRAQCLNMLRQLGVTPMPPSSVMEWMVMVDAGGKM